MGKRPRNKYVDALVAAGSMAHSAYQKYSRPAKKLKGSQFTGMRSDRGVKMPFPPPGGITISELKEKQKPRKGQGSGAWAKKQRKMKKGPTTHYQRDGSVVKLETGGEVTDDQAVYAGVGIPGGRLLPSMVRAILTCMFRRHGVEVVDWTKFPLVDNQLYTIQFRYFLPESVAPTEIKSTAYTQSSNQDTYANIAQQMTNQLLSDLGAMVLDIEFERAILYVGQAIAAEINLERLSFDVNSVAKITIQNRTLGSSSSTDIDSIGSNPLKGKVYEVNGNRYEHSGKISTADTPLTFLTDQSFGWIRTSTSSLPTVNALQKPPNVSYFHGAKGHGFLLQPGQSTTFTTSRKQHLSLKQLWKALGENVHIAQQKSSHTTLGSSIMVGLEKSLDSRSAEQEPPIILAFQTDVKLGIAYKYRALEQSNIIVEQTLAGSGVPAEAV